MKIFITGATGFIGRNLAEALHRDGHEVVATGRDRHVGAELAGQGITFEPADITVPGDLERVIGPADGIVHCAGRPGDRGDYDDFHSVNVLGTRHVIDHAQMSDIRRIVFISTPSIYHDGTDRLDIRESDPLPRRQTQFYGRTKLLAERDLQAWGRRGGQVIILRPRAVHGPHDGTILPRIVRMAEKPRFPLIGGGLALVDITYVENLVDAVRACLDAPDDAWNQVYNVSNGHPLQIREWFAQILDRLGIPFRPRTIPEPAAWAVAIASEAASLLPFGPDEPSMTTFSVGYMARSMTLNLEKARDRLGHVPRITNDEGIERTAAWWRSR